jgi:hypothetical protein
VTPGDVEFVQVVASMLVSTSLAALVVVLDERRLRGATLARAWPPASRDAALFGAWLFGALFGSVLLLVHFAKTRATVAGAALGLVFAVSLLAANVGAWVISAMLIEWLRL